MTLIGSAHSTPLVEGKVKETANVLLAGRQELADDLADYLIARDPALQNAGVEEMVRASCHANVTVMLDYVTRAVPVESLTAPTEVLRYTRAMVREGLSLDSVTAGYRAGTAFLIDRWTGQVAASEWDAHASVEVIRWGANYFWGWFEMVGEELSAESRAEISRFTRERSQARLEDVRHILAGADIDPERATHSLGYRVAGSHLAVVLYDRTDGPDRGSSLDQAVRTLSASLGVTGRLAVHADTRTMWCWMEWPSERVCGDIHMDGPVLVSIGRPATGLEGFRRSHREAVQALRVSNMTAARHANVVRYEDVAVLALCTTDETQSRDFIEYELGQLAADDALTHRQRETLLAFYASDSSLRAAAAALGVHHNTVRYRLEQIERRIGRDVHHRRIGFELALHLAEAVTFDKTPE